MEIPGGGDAALGQRTDNQNDETMEGERETGPVAFVSETTMNDTTQQLIKALNKRDR